MGRALGYQPEHYGFKPRLYYKATVGTLSKILTQFVLGALYDG